ncbi:MAG: phosphorylase [Candidatus Abyssobacteria bacterium SURF_17]|uniref:Phosphorylase n=1 Tax=Candidatus Abyssobacteria bacterium SURF_17 TaxID=2093361 RepID=A0A419F1Z3_9BACT|nr:MAG: phosphorylase [Candidatus Abyssubacteria bacterium SURF_17]
MRTQGDSPGTRRKRRLAASRKERQLPEFAVIGGSQAYRLLAQEAEKERLGERDTPFGKSQPVFLLTKPSGSFLFLSRHGEKGYSIAAPFVNYRANIYALKDLGVKQIVSWSGPGALSSDYRIGQFVLVDDVIDETRRRPATFFEHGGLGFVRQNPVFCPHMRDLLARALSGLKLDFASKGTYVCTEGPRLETPAEIRKFSVCGGHLVGMTLVPEVFLAKELEMCYAALCYVTNYAEGIRQKEFRPGILFEGLADRDEMEAVEESVSSFPSIIEAIARLAQENPPDCTCGQTMKRYRDRGDIGNDWHGWISVNADNQKQVPRRRREPRERRRRGRH